MKEKKKIKKMSAEVLSQFHAFLISSIPICWLMFRNLLIESF